MEWIAYFVLYCDVFFMEWIATLFHFTPYS